MDSISAAHVLVVAHRTATTPALLEAIRERAERGPVFFHLLVPNPSSVDWPQARVREAMIEGERVLARAIPVIEAAAHRPTDGSVSIRHDPMDAIEETLYAGDFDEIILSTLPRGLSRWLHMDLPRRVAHLGLPLTTVIVDDRETAGSGV
ncbi:MAG: hypothetical protein QOJ35_1433 [Solirubrobacteraceae bacterium]|jgi:hypothetical protein|nr:hypothetical protein [Solirubrobacteraceae bacterium]